MFSKYDVYTTVQSLYCYPDSNVLKNKLNIRDRNDLKQAEEEITSIKQYMLMESPIKERFTKTQLMNIHRFLFEDIYPFAGLIRREQISKGDTMFYPPHLIGQELDEVFSKLHSEKRLKDKGIRQSMPRKGNCLDNACAENFFGLLKTELLYLQEFHSVEHFIEELHEYIEWYNNKRIKLKLNGLSPIDFRQEAA